MLPLHRKPRLRNDSQLICYDSLDTLLSRKLLLPYQYPLSTLVLHTISVFFAEYEPTRITSRDRIASMKDSLSTSTSLAIVYLVIQSFVWCSISPIPLVMQKCTWPSRSSSSRRRERTSVSRYGAPSAMKTSWQETRCRNS